MSLSNCKIGSSQKRREPIQTTKRGLNCAAAARIQTTIIIDTFIYFCTSNQIIKIIKLKQSSVILLFFVFLSQVTVAAAKLGIPHMLSPSYTFQFLLWDPEFLPGQMRHIISPVGSGSTLKSPPSMAYLKNLQLDILWTGRNGDSSQSCP